MGGCDVQWCQVILVVVVVWVVYVVVCGFFFGGLVYVGYFYVEVQCLVGQWVVVVDVYYVVFDFGYGDVDYVLWVVILELYVGLDVFYVLECFMWYLLFQFGVVFVVVFGWCYVDFELVVCDMVNYYFFQFWYDLVGVMYVGEWFVFGGVVDYGVLVVGQCVVEGNNGVVSNLYEEFCVVGVILLVVIGMRD